ncbi:MAG TPA: hypothetical protein ENN13_02590, partial [Candidatus Altiarchaeales archaeon]|nr:hypothetical protein [Candidatus Altiarchaeales archaeon]
MDGELFNQRQNMSAILALSILVILAGCTSSPQQTQTSSTMLETANTRENITLIVDECNGTLRKPSDKDVLYQYSTI